MYYWRRGLVMQALGRFLIVAGVVLALVGLLVLLLGKLGPGGLPGDVVTQRSRVTIYLPIATSLLISLLLTALLWLLRR
jgi:hypothetical protein